jgi:hypothetical protein
MIVSDATITATRWRIVVLLSPLQKIGVSNETIRSRHNHRLGDRHSIIDRSNIFRGLIMKIGDYITTSIYGCALTVRVVALHGAGTVDVVTKDGRYFRVSGLGV